MQNENSVTIEAPVEVAPKESKKENIMSRLMKRMHVSVALAFAAVMALVAMVQPARAELTLNMPNLTPVGNVFISLINIGTSLASPTQALVEAWFGPLIEIIILIAVVFLVIFVFVVGPTKAVEFLEKLVGHMSK